MTISKLWQLEIKSFFRAPQWEVAVIAKIFIALFGIYLFFSIMAIGVGAYYIVEKVFPDEPTISLINQGIFFAFLIEFITRYFFQQSPSTQVQSWILLPIKKRIIINNLLLRSLINLFNFTPWLLYFPIAVVRVIEGTPWTTAFIWFAHLLCITLILNYLIFFINKSHRFLISTFVLILLGAGLEYHTDFSFYRNFALGLEWLEQNLISLLLSCGTLVLIYRLAYHYLKARFYLDMGLAKKSEKVLQLGFAFLGGYGRLGAFKKRFTVVVAQCAAQTNTALDILFSFLWLALFYNGHVQNQCGHVGFCIHVHHRRFFPELWPTSTIMGQ